MYGKCGSITEAKLVFDSQNEKDIAIWNAMISTYSAHGMVKDAVALSEQMKLSGTLPNNETFVALLSACTSGGLVEEGWQIFNAMENSYGISASFEHYTCMIGILGAAGLLDEALDLIKRMPYVPDARLWATLLQACRVHQNPEVERSAAKALFELEPNNASNHLLLSNTDEASGI